jgi:hypothetical protein
VQVLGTARCVDDPAGVLAIGRRIAAGMTGQPGPASTGSASTGSASPGELDDYVAHSARKRVGYIVAPQRIISWDHRKLLA